MILSASRVVAAGANTCKEVFMAFTTNSTISDIMKGKPNAKAIIDKHAGRPIDPAQLQMAMGMSLQQVANFVGWNKEKVDALLKDLNA
jgi:hypothetical protein